MYKFFLFLTFTFRHNVLCFYNTNTMKTHFKTHSNKGLFKKVVNEINPILKKVNNIFCHENIFFGGRNFSPKNSICILYMYQITQILRHFNEIYLKNIEWGSFPYESLSFVIVIDNVIYTA